MATIAIVDDHELLAEALGIALRESGQPAVRVPLTSADELLATVCAAAPELVLLDLDLGPYGDATQLVAPLTDAGIRVLVVTGTTDRLRIAAALEQGAVGFCNKADGFAALVAAARNALTTTQPLDPVTRVELLESLRRARAEQERALAPFRTLTEREREALLAMGHGQSVSEIAAAWVVSEATVRTHVRGVLGKLDVRSQLAAVGMALRCGWLRAPGDSARVTRE